VIGHAAAPTTNVMNSRRLIAAPGNSKQGIVLCLGNTLKGGCPLWVGSGHFAAFRAFAFDQQRQYPFQCTRDRAAVFVAMLAIAVARSVVQYADVGTGRYLVGHHRDGRDLGCRDLRRYLAAGIAASSVARPIVENVQPQTQGPGHKSNAVQK
jgi:hypothetical protein